MKNPFNRQSQFELFPGAPGAEPKKTESPLFGQPFQLSFENFIVFGMTFIMGMIVSFSFGVEKGKRIKTASLQKAGVIVDDQPVTRSEEADFAEVMEEEAPSAEDTGIHENQLKIDENTAGFEKSVDKKASLAKIHTIQVASFKQKDRAEREAGDLGEIGHDAFIAQKGSYYIVCVGHFEERQQAKELLRLLKKRYFDCYIRSL